MSNNLISDSSDLLKDYQIVYATQDDLIQLEWDGEYSRFRGIYADVFQRSQNGKAIMWLIKSTGGDLIGQVFVQLPKSTRHPVYLHAFRVKEQYRGLGIGSLLMERVEQETKSIGYSIMTLNVAFDNPKALKLYRIRGYRIYDNTPEYWSYRDEFGEIQQVHEPSWRLKKKL